MLASLSIRDVVLIDRLELEGAGNLSALTGETGAGKSILLDALGLALGGRAEAGLVRRGAEQASVTACFDVPKNHPARALLKEKDLPAADTLILRRTLSKDGRSKAFINDAPVSVQLLKETGALLVEIHGQFETQGLLDPATHRGLLDDYAGLTAETAKVGAAWQTWRGALARLEQAREEAKTAGAQEDYLRHSVAELEKLAPQAGEEETLAAKRSLLLNREKMSSALEQAAQIIDGEDGLQSLLGRVQTLLARLDAASLNETLARVHAEISELSYQVDSLRDGRGAENLAEIEDRYFALRESAKKHRCTSDDLPKLLEELAARLRLITHQDDALAALEKAVAEAKELYIRIAEKLSAARGKAALKMAKAVNAELPDLKLGSATFSVAVERAAQEAGWGPEGIDKVQFVTATNAGAAAGPLHKIASGGELSRFTLALKLILAETGSVPTLIFDEVDSGIGGATADAVGERLARLAEKYQVLVVTHSPQVAARAAHHWIVAKSEQKGTVITRVTPLRALQEREEEIARMISGAKVTAEARAAAAKLLESHAA